MGKTVKEIHERILPTLGGPGPHYEILGLTVKIFTFRGMSEIVRIIKIIRSLIWHKRKTLHF